MDLYTGDQSVGSLVSIAGAGGSITTTDPSTSTHTLTIGGSTKPAGSFGLVIKDGTTAKLGFTRSGSGTTVLTAANTYTGTTTVTGGSLIVNGSLASGSAVTVAGGALGGSGTVAGTVTASSTGILSPGAL